jgi:8-oxo-dGTP pyrophosphatase MutT (NUDIX family)
LPGGKAEPGEDAIQTALREANEEVGADRDQIQILGKLSEFYVIPSNFLITPVVGMSLTKLSLIPDTHEVVKILTARLSDLLRDDAVRTKEILAAGRYALMAPHFEVEGEIVWGATAMILNELRMVIRGIVGSY